MRILPKRKDFLAWAELVPESGDLLFFSRRDRKLSKLLGFPIYTPEEVRAQSLELWSLVQRSWYGYALNRADHCVWLPRGELERLPRGLQAKLQSAQKRLGVPTVLPRLGWVTAQVWSKLPKARRIEVLGKWLKQNEIYSYESVAWRDLPAVAREILREFGFDQLLNRYAENSGPNCLATAAAAALRQPSLVKVWLHAEPFLRILKGARFAPIQNREPQPGDLLIFVKAGEPVHAALALGSGLYFEKPGQDFYEPYRIGQFNQRTKEWPGIKVATWRRRSR